MAQFAKVTFVLLTLCAVSTYAIKCQSCASEEACKNPDQITCGDDLGCSKVTNTKPSILTKGCFSPMGAALVSQNQCKDAKIGEVQANYCRCNDKDLCNSASGYSFLALSAPIVAMLAAKLIA